MSKHMQLRKVPLEDLIKILTDLYEDGVNYIDISGEPSDDEDNPKDLIKITIRPEYMINEEDDEEEDDEDEIEEDYYKSDRRKNIDVDRLSEDDINNLL